MPLHKRYIPLQLVLVVFSFHAATCTNTALALEQFVLCGGGSGYASTLYIYIGSEYVCGNGSLYISPMTWASQPYAQLQIPAV